MKTLIPLLLFVILFCPASFAQIQHLPTVFHDFDGDGVVDFKIERGFSPALDFSVEYSSLIPLNGAEIVETGGRESYVTYFDFGDTISQSNIWTNSKELIYEKHSFRPEAWKNNKDYFFGIRILKNEKYHYGWIRFRANTDWGHKILRDAALQVEPDVPILAGEGISGINAVVDTVYNINNNSKWSDFEVQFFPPYYSSFVQEYRIIIAKNEKEINIDQLLAADSISYQKVEAGSFEYKIPLNDNILDIEKEKFKIGEKYKICVLTISNNQDSFPHAFSTTSPFKLNVTLPPVPSVIVLDEKNFGDGRDILVRFDQNNKYQFTKEYRILILPEDSVSDFNLAKASSIPENITKVISPGEDSVYTTRDYPFVDIYGNTLRENVKYKALVLSVNDEIKSNVSSLSPASNDFALGNPNFIYVSQSEGLDIIHKQLDKPSYNPINSLDIDNDKQPDVFIEMVEFTEGNTRFILNTVAYTADSTEIIVSENKLAKNIADFAPVYSGNNWSKDTLTLKYIRRIHGSGPSYGEFDFRGTIGFRKLTSTDTIYGWIKVENQVIQEYAYQNRYLLGIPKIPIKKDALFTSFPNPSKSSKIQVFIKEYAVSEKYFIDVLDISGNTIKSLRINTQLIQLSLNGLEKGNYFIRLRTPNKQETQKIMLQ